MTITATGGDSPSSSSTCPCPQCGFAVPMASDADAQLRQAQQKIQALEAQVALLDQKAAAAIDRWADYEDELTALRRRLAAGVESGGSGASASSGNPPLTPSSPTRTSFLPTGAANRLSALLSPRPAKSTPNLKAAAAASNTSMPPPPLPSLPPHSPTQPSQPAQSIPQPNVPTAGMPTPPPSATTNTNVAGGGYGYDSAATSPAPRTPYGSFPFFGGKTPPPPQHPEPVVDNGPSTKELLDALTREQKLRRQAEGRLQDTSREVEELSVSLFEQANEMVAEERRARARLEARVAVLEQRDTDKKRRLERLEQAMDRIERLRAMLGTVETAISNRRPSRDDESLHEKQKLPVAAALA